LLIEINAALLIHFINDAGIVRGLSKCPQG
jgi:hypothetical protein